MNELILFAVNQSGGQPPGPAGCMQTMPLMILLFAVFYFLLIRPQQKRQREHQAMLARLKKGDRVATNGGLIGAITKLTDHEVELEVSERVKVKVLRQYVTLLPSAPAGGEIKEKGK